MFKMMGSFCCDNDVRKDLKQEMILAIINAKKGKEDKYYMACAKYAAIDYMKKFHNKREIPFSELSEVDRNKIRGMIDLGDIEDE